MFDVIKRMFGEGKIRFRGVITDGISFTGSIPYIGDIGAESRGSIERMIKKTMYVDKGVRVHSLEFLVDA